jgi:uncharacterized protein YeaO (DUF488 family)
MLRTKSVYSRIESKDGIRILVTRFRGRGLPKRRYSVWMANLAPSEALLRAGQRGTISWAEFGRRYKQELFAPASFDRRNRTIKNHGQKFTLRLLCHCDEDQQQCHRHILEHVIKSNRV